MRNIRKQEVPTSFGIGSSSGPSGGGGDDPPLQLEKRVEAIEHAWPTVAEKSDIAKLDGRIDKLDGRMDKLDAKVEQLSLSLNARMDNLVASINHQFSEFKLELQRSISSSNRWMHGAAVTLFGTFVVGSLGLLIGIYNTGNQAEIAQLPAQPAAPPIIIQIPYPAPMTVPVLPVAPN